MNLPDYELLTFIGRGGYGEVWLARDGAGRHWAVKIVYRSRFDDDRPYEREYRGILRFVPVSGQSEAQLRIVHLGRRDEIGCFYYIMELADDASGAAAISPDTYVPHTLRSELRQRRRIPAGEAVGLAWALTQALENLHANGLVHRDIKPGNIVFVGGRPKLADVGLVTDADLTGTFAGTEGYIPPEGPGTYRADIYSLGMTIYEACTGCDRRQFPALPENVVELPDHQALLRLVRVVNRACQPSLPRRYQSAVELRGDLERLMTGRPVREQERKSRRVLASALAIGATVVALGLPNFRRTDSPPSNTPQPTVISSGESHAPRTPAIESTNRLAPEEVATSEAAAIAQALREIPVSGLNQETDSTELVTSRMPRKRAPPRPSAQVLPPAVKWITTREDAVRAAESRWEEARSALDRVIAKKNEIGLLISKRRRAAKAKLENQWNVLRVEESRWQREMAGRKADLDAARTQLEIYRRSRLTP